MRTSVRAIVIKDSKLLVMDRNKFGRKYLSLIGGEVEKGETLEDALQREVLEETTLKISNLRLVIKEDAGDIYGMQYIYLCDYVSGEVQLDPSSIESKISVGGKNLYVPRWLDISELASSKLLPHELKETLVRFVKDGFPLEEIELRISDISEI